jgi:hypothetical protein
VPVCQGLCLSPHGRPPDFDELVRQRPTVERQQAHWNRKGRARSRYFGQEKTRLQVFWSAALVNLERLMVLGGALSALAVPQGQPT